MRTSAALAGLLLCCAARPAPAEPGRPLKAVLAEAGLGYSGPRPYAVDKNYRRGDWSGARPAFWTLSAADGRVRLRLELTKNVGADQARRTMAERFLRIDALYSGGAAYPGMVTTEFEVPAELRPKNLRTKPGEKVVKVLAATPSLAYGAGAEDLVGYRGLLGYVYCEKTALLAQIELFFPKREFDQQSALLEFDRISCSAPSEGRAKTVAAPRSTEKQ
ncbi:MAG TPA: hypothetical protein DEQ38_14210 [Elusimicrobia bacterium]|nr:MAG: hypothetical protein A2089_07080 [Elusimicrobia bacterium GWD2_63_28]HCC49251.1 hypothetical protein [Elusimicrobiota bacterium]